jgi:hypothetical protein
MIVALSCGRAPQLAPEEVLRLASTRLGQAREWHVDCRVSTYVRERKPSEREQSDMRISMRRVSYAEFIAAAGDPKMAQPDNTSDYMLLTLRMDGNGFRGAREVRVAFCCELHEGGMAPIALFLYNRGTPKEFFGIPQGFSQYDIFELATMVLAMALVPCQWNSDAGEYGLLAGDIWSIPGLRVWRAGDRVIARHEDRGLLAGDWTEVTTEVDPRTRLVESFRVRSYANKDGESDLIVEMKYLFSRQRLVASQAREQP